MKRGSSSSDPSVLASDEDDLIMEGHGTSSPAGRLPSAILGSTPTLAFSGHVIHTGRSRGGHGKGRDMPVVKEGYTNIVKTVRKDSHGLAMRKNSKE